MTEFVKALHVFWSNFGMPAYQQDQVPAFQAFPYITYEVIEGAPFSQMVLTARGWFAEQENESVNAEVAAFLDEVKNAIPPQGVKIASGDGFFVLSPNGAGFLSYETDPDTLEDGRRIVSARVSYELSYYL